MKSPVFPPIEAVIDLYHELMEEHGGAPGLRDRGALEASLARPLQMMTFAEGEVTVFDLAAAVCASIIRNHPFVDGNKRAGFLALGLVLGLNGPYLDATEHEAYEAVMALAAGGMTEDDFRRWVERHSYEA